MKKKYAVNWFDQVECVYTDIIYANSAEEAESLAKSKYPVGKWPAPLCKATLMDEK